MLLWSLLGLGIVLLLGYEIDFAVWLLSVATLQAITAYILTRNMFILKTYLPVALLGALSFLLVPGLLTDTDLPPGLKSKLEVFFEVGPIIIGVWSIAVSTFVGLFDVKGSKSAVSSTE